MGGGHKLRVGLGFVLRGCRGWWRWDQGVWDLALGSLSGPELRLQ